MLADETAKALLVKATITNKTDLLIDIIKTPLYSRIDSIRLNKLF